MNKRWDPGLVLVADVMTREVETLRRNDKLSIADDVTKQKRIRHLPVLDEEDTLVGMITLADLAREAEREQNLQSPSIHGNEISVTLASICQPPRHDLVS